ncbi:MAG: hypothetical protein FWF05_06085 [Oscillospiraceae bacterium]|nr:hypothetical protein [Oscillospiraceae bacterium]
MKTKRQEELINSFLSELGDELRPLYQDIAMYLSELGYNPRKQRSYIVFKHDLHNKEMAKMGMAWTKDHSPYFALRFSACKGYSQGFADIIKDYIHKNPGRLFPHCVDGKCVFREDGDRTPFYEYVFPDGAAQSFCGAKALVIPSITSEDMEEIKKLIKEEHEYLLG